jgi:hypothetical protein
VQVGVLTLAKPHCGTGGGCLRLLWCYKCFMGSAKDRVKTPIWIYLKKNCVLLHNKK